MEPGSASAEPHITVERDGHVLLMGLNRPRKFNAFNLQTIDELGKAYELLGKIPQLRVGVLFSHGQHFSSGLQLDQVGSAVDKRGPQIIAGNDTYDPFGIWKDPVPKPIVLAVGGIAFTLSIELALACDIVICGDDVRFRQMEVARGIMPFGGATFRAPAQLGWGNAMRFLLTGAEFGAQEALRIGLVQEVVPAGTQADRAREIAHLIAAQAPLGVQATLRNARCGATDGPEAAALNIRDVLPTVLHSEDAAEGVRSYLERREATFTGH